MNSGYYPGEHTSQAAKLQPCNIQHSSVSTTADPNSDRLAAGHAKSCVAFRFTQVRKCFCDKRWETVLLAQCVRNISIQLDFKQLKEIVDGDFYLFEPKPSTYRAG